MTTPQELGRAPYIQLVSFRRDGSPVETPVWCVELADVIYVFTDSTSFKVKRIRRNPNARIATCNWNGSRRTGEWVDAQASIMPRAAETEEIRKADNKKTANSEDAIYDALMAKYGWHMRMVNMVSWMGGRIGRRCIMEIRMNDRTGKPENNRTTER